MHVYEFVYEFMSWQISKFEPLLAPPPKKKKSKRCACIYMLQLPTSVTEK